MIRPRVSCPARWEDEYDDELEDDDVPGDAWTYVLAAAVGICLAVALVCQCLRWFGRI